MAVNYLFTLSGRPVAKQRIQLRIKWQRIQVISIRGRKRSGSHYKRLLVVDPDMCRVSFLWPVTSELQ